MARSIEFLDKSLCIHLTGLVSAAALKKRLEIPYVNIKGVKVGPFKMPQLSFRIGTSGIGNNLKEGRFLHKGDWYFLSYTNHKHVLIMELENFEYKNVVLELEHVEEVKERIEKKCL